MNELSDLASKWEQQAIASREEAVRIRRTIKAPTGAEERCLVRAEIWDKCAEELRATDHMAVEQRSEKP